MKINIGRYIPGDSIIHKMDARIKLFSNISFIVLFFLANTFILQAILVFPLLISFIIATRKPLHLLKMMDSISRKLVWCFRRADCFRG